MKKILLTLVVMLLVSVTVLTACDLFNFNFKDQLDVPQVILDSENKTVKWGNVVNAEEYVLYLNNEQIKTETADPLTNYYEYDFSLNIKEGVLKYKFNVVAKADGFNDSEMGAGVTYTPESDFRVQQTLEGIDVDNSDLTIIKNLKNVNNILSWSEVAGAQKYYVLIDVNVQDQILVTTTTAMLDISDYTETYGGEVLTIRVGVEKNQGINQTNKNVMFGSQLFVNTISIASNYDEQFYSFSGEFKDFYITSQEELNHFIYYAYIEKLTTFYAEFSPEFLKSISNLSNAVQIAINSFLETSNFTIEFSQSITNVVTFKYDFATYSNLTSSYKGAIYTSDKTVTQSYLDTPYYEKVVGKTIDGVTYEMRDANYNNFISDKMTTYQVVETTEELVHAVESGVTPMFLKSTDDAYIYYNQAKDILRQIVTDNMTDYEIALSVFDYITVNSVYDHNIIEMSKANHFDYGTGTYVSELDKLNRHTTEYSSFYLEGVLRDGIAVCDGYSKLYSLLLNMEGIETVRVTGNVSGGGHAWNKIKLNGSWYVVDITWSVNTTGSNDWSAADGEAVNFNDAELFSYNYFLVSDNQISTHIPVKNAFVNNPSAPNDYFYFANQSYVSGKVVTATDSADDMFDLIIESDAEYQAVLNYMFDNEIYSMELAFDLSYVGLNARDFGTLTSKNKVAVDSIKHGNILSSGGQFKYVSATTQGYLYNINLINL